jgi:hypothetical protein
VGRGLGRGWRHVVSLGGGAIDLGPSGARFVSGPALVGCVGGLRGRGWTRGTAGSPSVSVARGQEARPCRTRVGHTWARSRHGWRKSALW